MTWTLSRFRTGDLVEVRTRDEILATLDHRGCIDELPFMPEMLQFCGQRFRVRAVAHKTCDTNRRTRKGRRVRAAVHLQDLRCDGSAHGGCQAECSLFWKDVWLKPVDDHHSTSREPIAAQTEAQLGGCTEAKLLANTSVQAEGNTPRYACQATRLYEASDALDWWDARQYVYDIVTGNHSVGRVTRVIWLAVLRWTLVRLPIGRRPFRAFHDWMHLYLTGRPAPSLAAKITRGMATPTGRLDLKPGERVCIKSQREIEETVDERGKNRGLFFDWEEMAPYCGREFKVRRSVTRIIEEPTGTMIDMKQPCIILDGVLCQAEYASNRLNCPRAIPSYWRELWLERVPEPGSAGKEG